MSRLKRKPILTVEVVRRSELSDLPSDQKLKGLIEKAWQIYAGPRAVHCTLVLMDEAEHTALHKQFLGDANPTDVMAFPYGDEDLYGEILVNVEMAARECAFHDKFFYEEISLYIVHGALHLIGFDDLCEPSRCNMRIAEQRVLGD